MTYQVRIQYRTRSGDYIHAAFDSPDGVVLGPKEVAAFALSHLSEGGNVVSVKLLWSPTGPLEAVIKNINQAASG